MIQNTKINSRIIATGSYLPEKIVTNFDLEKSVETTNEWIKERTGIDQRHIASSEELTSDLAFKAATSCLNQINKSVKEIEMIVVATTTPDLTFPSTATTLQAKLGAVNAFAFDIQAVCSGFVFAVSVANNFIKSGQVKNALVVGADILSRIVDWKDRNTCILFGDGAGAVLLEATTETNQGIISSDLKSDGNLNQILKTSGGVSFNQQVGVIQMSGKEVFKHAVEKMSSSVISSLNKANLTPADVDLLVPHQANLRILDAVATRLGIPSNKVAITLPLHANTSAASIPLALDCINRKNKIKEGSVVVLEALGGGLTWGSIVIRW